MSVDSLRSVLVMLLALALPLWLLAGFGDWLCHRRTLIQQNAGPRESAFHLVLYLVIALPVVLGLFLQVSAALLLLMTLCVLAHSAVSLWDTSYAQPRRHISPVEQMIHSHLEMLPVFALALVMALHWDEVREPRWTLAAREPRLPGAWTLGVSILLVPGLLLILEELARGLRAQPNG
jgi:hypothetical protein